MSGREASPVAGDKYLRIESANAPKGYAVSEPLQEPIEPMTGPVRVLPQASSGACGPWLSVVDAARHAGWPCPNGRAPASFYQLAELIGVKMNGKWRIHVDDLDAELRRHAVSR